MQSKHRMYNGGALPHAGRPEDDLNGLDQRTELDQRSSNTESRESLTNASQKSLCRFVSTGNIREKRVLRKT